MRKFLAGALFLFSAMTVAQAQPARPRITGISYIRFASTDLVGAEKLYGQALGLTRVRRNAMAVYLVGASQTIEMDPVTAPVAGTVMLEEIGFETANTEAMKQYLRAQGVSRFVDVPHGFALADRDAPRIAFVTRQVNPVHDLNREVVHRVIHAGFAVGDRAPQDAFFRDVLGFKEYWQGSHDGGAELDWVSMQAPEGREWIEYMLRQKPNATRRQMGSAYHVSFGVESMPAALTRIQLNGWKDAAHTDAATLKLQPTAGLDGKWQFNLWDPDESRIELMEFAPYTKPCCHEFMQPHPAPADR